MMNFTQYDLFRLWKKGEENSKYQNYICFLFLKQNCAWIRCLEWTAHGDVLVQFLFVLTDLSVKLWERSVTTVHSSSWGQGALWRGGHGLMFGPVASSGQVPAQSAAVLRGWAWKKEEDRLRQEGTAEAQLTDKSDFKGCWDSRMPNPLLALMERPGSARFLVMEGMLTEPLNPARLSWTRTFWFKQDRVQGGGGEKWGGCERAQTHQHKYDSTKEV